MNISPSTSETVVTASGGRGRVSGQAIPATPSPSASSAPTKAAGADAAPQVFSPEQVAQAINQVNNDFVQKGQGLYASFERNKTTGIDVVKIVDKNTQEVITQLPPKEIVAIAEEIERNQEGKGHLVYNRA